jgi:hypothetical protein
VRGFFAPRKKHLRNHASSAHEARAPPAWLVGAAVVSAVVNLAGCVPEPTLKESVTPSVDTHPIPTRAAAAVSDATGSALQGDVASSLKMLAEVPQADYAGDALAFRDCMLARFGAMAAAPAPLALGDDPWIAALGHAYVHYWRKVLMRSAPINAAEDDLAAAVGQLIARRMTKADELDDAEAQILAAVEAHGLHALLGRTAPLRELMLWKKQTKLERDVDLPGGRERVTVMLLDDFLLRGWGYCATCGRRSAGGWTTETALYAVAPAYQNLDDEVFSVRFLDHEAQHFADKRMFPGIESWELEYRAKLVEMSLGTVSQPATLKLFCENRSDSKDAPHGYANARVVREVAQGLAIDPATLCGDAALSTQATHAIQALGRKLLADDTAMRLVAAGAASAPAHSPN